jgi:hypothetical protein
MQQFHSFHHHEQHGQNSDMPAYSQQATIMPNGATNQHTRASDGYTPMPQHMMQWDAMHVSAQRYNDPYQSQVRHPQLDQPRQVPMDFFPWQADMHPDMGFTATGQNRVRRGAPTTAMVSLNLQYHFMQACLAELT